MTRGRPHRLRPGIFLKIFLSMLALIVLTGSVVAWIAAAQIRSEVEEETRVRLRKQVATLEALLDPAGGPIAYDADRQERARRVGQHLDIRITFLDADGAVAADSHKDPRGMENHADRPEVRASLTGPFGESIRHSGTLDLEMVYVARALRVGGQLRGYVRAAQPLENIESRFRGLRETMLRALGMAILFGFLGAVLVTRRLARPMRELSAAAAAVAAGDFTRRVPVSSHDEVGDLGQSFNEMAARLEQEIATIRQDQRESRAILGGMVEGVVAVDAEERIVLLNAAARQLLGIPVDELPGRVLWESVRVPTLTAAVADALEHGTVQRGTVRLGAAAQERVVQLYAAPLLGDDGQTRGAVLVLNDITDRERVESMRRDFVANASHELKTPLASVRALIETILDDDAMPTDTRRGFLVRVVSQVDRLVAMVQEMLALSRLEAQRSQERAEPVDAREAIEAVVDESAPLAKDRRVKIVVALPEQACRVRADAEALRRIVGNLLDNALKHSPSGGEVALSATATQDTLTIAVRDHGPGIALEKQERIFERFYRVDEGRSRDAGGTGLGLAIVKHLVSALDGQVAVQSTPGAGSTFRVTLPLAAAPGA
ncbi:MAG: ATP-binding protein [Planctomycetota bacterium]|nr:ATP-binding protein [Planctomycetota bacterium]